MTGWDDAIEELSVRMLATAGLDADSDDLVVMVEGRPDELIRRLLSGYVATEDMDRVLGMLRGLAMATYRMIATAPNPAVADAAIRFTAAQMLVLGAALGREGAPRCDDEEAER